MVDARARSAFHRLTPDLVLDLVEKALGIRCTNLCPPLASYILSRCSRGQGLGPVFCEGIQAAGVLHALLPLSGAKCGHLPKSGRFGGAFFVDMPVDSRS